MVKVLPRRTNLRLLMRRPDAFVRAYWAGLAALLAAAAADGLTTYWNMRQYGTDIELHVVQRLVSELVGVALGVPLAKAIQLCFVLFVAAWWRAWCRWILWGCSVLYALAAANNYWLWL